MTTATATHTPGPWRMIRRSAMGDPKRPYAEAEYRIAADRQIATVDPVNADANARLIAAAPELLAVCKAVVENIRDGNHQGSATMLKMLDAAIAKATPLTTP